MPWVVRVRLSLLMSTGTRIALADFDWYPYPCVVRVRSEMSATGWVVVVTTS